MPRGPAQRDNGAPAPISWPHNQLQNVYVANICSARAIWHLKQAHGAGDSAVSLIAQRQLGVITAGQLALAGLGRDGVARRVARGSLHRLYRGVYLVGHPTPVPGAIELAAVLACGRGALISHRSAAMLWGLVDGPVQGVQVTVVARHCRPRAGLRIHRVRELHARDLRRRNGIPVTAPARTLIDFATEATADELGRAIAEASVLNLLDEAEFKNAIKRAGKRPGVRRIGGFLAEEGVAPTRSGGERKLRGLIRAADLPMPMVNVRVAGFLADFVWQEQQLIVEVDGYPYHRHRAAFERDRRKDMALRNAGYEVIRVTWRALVDEPFAVVAHLARTLERCRRP